MTLAISSLQNGRIKQVIKLRQRRHRDAAQLTVVEGVREVQQALAQGIRPLHIFVCPEIDAPATAAVLAHAATSAAAETAVFEVTAAVYAKMAYRGDSGGVLMTVPYWAHTLTALPLAHVKRPLLAIIENVEKPGNLGAILRTADAAGVDGIIVCGDDAHHMTDIFNPNVIRASLGAIFTVPVAVATTSEVLAWLCQRQISRVAATPEGSVAYTAVDMTTATAIFTGSEAHGLSRAVLDAATAQVVIPMFGKVDSLNLSVSTALLLYEAVRQRQPQSAPN